MPLPDFNEHGDLPEGVHAANFVEVLARFGSGTGQRIEVTGRLQRIWDMANATRKLDRFILFGSYVSDTPSPKDVDVILVMHDDFRPGNCPEQCLALFNHQRAEHELGASIFWIRPGMLLQEPIDLFVAHWQIKRDGRRRGIVEVQP
jgi:hypothetical protein